MNEANTKKLYEDFPKLYRGRKRTIQESLMPFGFMCDDGWFKIVYDLSKKISKLDPDCEAVEVKEKWGGLRFYINASCRKVFDAIDKAEELSYHTCEECGKQGGLREDLPWVLTLCLKHYKEYLVEHSPKKQKIAFNDISKMIISGLKKQGKKKK